LEHTLFLGFEGADWATDNWSFGLVIEPAHDSLFSSPLFHHTSWGVWKRIAVVVDASGLVDAATQGQTPTTSLQLELEVPFSNASQESAL
jgi:hypothetical protein